MFHALYTNWFDQVSNMKRGREAMRKHLQTDRINRRTCNHKVVMEARQNRKIPYSDPLRVMDEFQQHLNGAMGVTCEIIGEVF